MVASLLSSILFMAVEVDAPVGCASLLASEYVGLLDGDLSQEFLLNTGRFFFLSIFSSIFVAKVIASVKNPRGWRSS